MGKKLSLSRKIMLPLTLLWLASGGVILLLSWRSGENQLEQRLEERAQIILSSVQITAETVSRISDLRRMVMSMGGKRGVNNLLIVAGEPPTIIASTHAEQNLQALDAFSDEYEAKFILKSVMHSNNILNSTNATGTMTTPSPCD